MAILKPHFLFTPLTQATDRILSDLVDLHFAHTRLLEYGAQEDLAQVWPPRALKRDQSQRYDVGASYRRGEVSARPCRPAG